MMINLPLKTVQKMASQQYIDKVLIDVETLREYTETIVDRGLDLPLEVYVNPLTGWCWLYDGHHRLVICSHLGYISLPVTITFSDKEIDYGCAASEVLPDMLAYLTEQD
jgi:ParB-like chromosome segregation protein Spo0J